MSAGIQPNTNTVNQTAGQLATTLRDTLQEIVNFNNWLGAFGGASALITLGFSSSDANTIISTFGNLNTLSNVANGTATQGATFNYIANTEALWGGQ